MKNVCCCVVLIMLLSAACQRFSKTETIGKSAEEVPTFKVDPFWPKPLPDNWLLGQVTGVAVDSKDNIWIIHRPSRVGDDEAIPNIPKNEQKLPFIPAPPVLEFDTDGNVINSWGGPGEGFDWPKSEHGIFIDYEDNIWIGGAISTEEDQQVLKFKSDGTFLLQIGKPGKTGGSNDTTLLGRPTDIAVDSISNEVYIADGYLNRRIIVFDAVTGKYKRHWGAYGNIPDDSVRVTNISQTNMHQQFNTVHSVRISNDNLVYVCDRGNNRIQVFEKNGNFLFEEFIAKNTAGYGSVWDVEFSHDPLQKQIYVADGTNQCIWILQRKNLKELGHFGRTGRYAGQFIWVHNVACDSRGNLYTTEVRSGKRVQKFSYQVMN